MKFLDNQSNEHDDIMGVIKSNITNGIRNPIDELISKFRKDKIKQDEQKVTPVPVIRIENGPYTDEYQYCDPDSELVSVNQLCLEATENGSLTLWESNPDGEAEPRIIAQTTVSDGLDVAGLNIQQQLSLVCQKDLEDIEDVIARWKPELEAVVTDVDASGINVSQILDGAANLCGDVMSKQIGHNDPSAMEKFTNYFKRLLKKAYEPKC